MDVIFLMTAKELKKNTSVTISVEKCELLILSAHRQKLHFRIGYPEKRYSFVFLQFQTKLRHIKTLNFLQFSINPLRPLTKKKMKWA